MNDVGLLTPLILLPGVALLIVSTSARYSRLHDEVHGILHDRQAPPLVVNGLLRRGRLFRNALVLLYVCVALFSLASLLGMGAILWEQDELGVWIVLLITTGGILCLTIAAVVLIREALLSLKVIEAHRHLSDEHAHDPLAK